MPLSPVRVVMLAGAVALAASCDKYNSPPEVAIIGLQEGRLGDIKAPIDLAFSEPVDPASLRVKIVRLQTDGEGNLEGDPGAAPGTVSPLLFAHEPAGDTGGTSAFSEGNTRFRITIDQKNPLPVGAALALVIEPGLRDLDGIDTVVRRRIPFGYNFVSTGATPGPFKTGQYFFLVSVVKPLGLQVQLVADIRVNPDTGAFLGQFTNADRKTDPDRCPTACKKSEVCKLLPAPECVAPSTKAGSILEFPDFYANNTPPAGFSFTAKGSAEEQTPGVVTFGNEPVDAQVQLPKLTIKNIVLAGSFAQADNLFKGTGTFTATEVLLGTIPSGAGEGTFEALRVPDDQLFTDLPAPPAQ